MRSGFIRFGGVFAIAFVGVALLASCLVGPDKVKSYAIKLPAALPTYGDGNYITMQYSLYLVNNNPQPLSGKIEMTWQAASMKLPFTSNLDQPLLRYRFHEVNANGEKTSVQYIKQDSAGSIFVHAFEGLVVENSFWPNTLHTPLQPNDVPIPVQSFWSPIDDGMGTRSVGTNYALNSAMDFSVVGPCSPTATTLCPSIAEFYFDQYQIIDQPLSVVETPLGKFEAYELQYKGRMITTGGLSQSPYFDYRISCWIPGDAATVEFQGRVLIYPPIGPVQIENGCNNGSSDTATAQQVYYTAQITRTNIQH